MALAAACPPPASGALCALPPGARVELALPLAAGDLLHVAVVAPEANLALGLDSPAGERLVEVDELSGPAGVEELWHVAAAAGDYRLRLESKSARPARATWLDVERRPAGEPDRARVAAVTAERELRPALDGADAEARRAALERWPTVARELAGLGLEERAANLERYAGRALLREKDEAGARARFAAAADSAGRLGAHRLLAYALDELGQIEQRAGRFPAAVDLYRRELAAAERSGYAPARALARLNLGTALQRVGETDAALAGYVEAAALYAELGQEDNVARCRFNEGGVRFHRGDLDAARAAFEQARAFFGARGDRAALRVIDSNLGAVENALGRPELAVEIYERALALGADESPAALRSRVGLLGNLGSALARLGRYPEARARYEEGERLARAAGQLDHLSAALHNLGDLAELEGRGDTAGPHFEASVAAARASGDLERLAGALFVLAGHRARAGAWAEARAAVDEGLAIALEQGFALRELELRRRRAEIERAAGRLDAALEEIGRARDLAERQRGRLARELDRATYLARLRPIHDLEALLLLELDARDPDRGHAAAAFAALERGRARALADLLAPRADPATAPAVEAPAVAVAEVAARLPPGAVLFEYLLAETAEESRLFVVGRDGLAAAVRLAPPAEIAAAVAALLEVASAPAALGAGLYAERAVRLHELLIAPAAEWLAGAETLIVSADGPLHRLPFAALVRRPSGASFAALDYLARDLAVARLPSPSAAFALAARARAAEGEARRAPIVAFGDPRPATDGAAAGAARAELAPLPASRDEVAALLALFPGALGFLGGDASETRVKREAAIARAERLHFAVHGLPNERRPELSALVLDAGDAGEDGRLEAWEIARLRLDAELVVLSACRSALGREAAGEGLLGLTRAFFEAGAPRVLATLWAVDDRATATFMTRFYRRLARGEAAVAALAGAQRETLAAGGLDAHPARWAAFVLDGDPGFAPPAQGPTSDQPPLEPRSKPSAKSAP